MDDDNLMPNDGTYYMPREPQDQIIGRKKEKAQTLEGKTVLNDLLKRWKEKIRFYESVNAIPEDVKMKPDQFMHAVTANAVIVEILEAEKEYIEDLIKSYVP